MHEDEFTPKFRDPNDPEFRAFSLRDQRLLDANHPSETGAMLLTIPLGIYFFRSTAKLVRNRRPSRTAKAFGLLFWGFGTIYAASIFATGMTNMALLQRAPNYAQMRTYIERHDGNDWRYKYWTSNILDWWLGRKYWVWVKPGQFHGKLKYRYEEKYQQEVWELERKRDEEKTNLREEIKKLKERKRTPPEGPELP